MDTLQDLDVVRAVPPSSELRAAEDDSLGVLTGHFSVFDSWYEVDSYFEGRFMESVAKGSFVKTIRETGDQVKVLYDHGHDFNIGNKVLGVPTALREDKVGPFYEVPLFDTTYNRDLLPGLEADAYGASFRFRVVKDEWNDEPGRSDHNPEGIPERIIKEVRLFEFGPVTFPANPAATAGVRSMTDDFYDHLRRVNPEAYNDLAARARTLRTPATERAEGAREEDGAAPVSNEPREHSEVTDPRARDRALKLSGVT